MNAEEMERILIEHPDVTEVCVIGVSDAGGSRYSKAYVVLSASACVDEDGLRAYCQELMPSFAESGDIAILPELPRTPMGRVSRRELAEKHTSEELTRKLRIA